MHPQRLVFLDLISNEKNFQSIIKNTTYGAHYYTGIKIFKDNPLIGSGLKTFRIECHKEKYIDKTLKFEGCSTHPHQIYIEFLSDLGLLGTLSIILFIFYTLIKNFKVLPSQVQFKFISQPSIHSNTMYKN